jgi:D-glycero-D-manno-heptose 1,7-bisphosphate phosphatase
MKQQLKSFTEFIDEDNTQHALFLDLDHTVIHPKSGGTFPKDKNDWEFIPGVLKKIKLFQEKGYKVIIASNQGGIAAKFITEEDVKRKFSDIKSAAKKAGVNITDMYYSKTNSAKDPQRKPNPGMALQAKREHDIDLSKSIMVGDKDDDKNFSNNAGMSKFYWIKDFKNLEENEL